MSEYRAPQEAWHSAIRTVMHSPAGIAACLLELKERIRNLEEAENDRRFQDCKQIIDNAKPTPNDRQIRSSLVERVAYAITGDSDGPINWKPEARAAIREVARWMDENQSPVTAQWLEQEAEHG